MPTTQKTPTAGQDLSFLEKIGDMVTSFSEDVAGFITRLVDCSQGAGQHQCSAAEAGWQGFQAYRDRVLGRPRE